MVETNTKVISHKPVEIIEDEPAPDKDFKDILDALKDGMSVFNENEYSLDKNYVWCRNPDEKWLNFHTRQHIVAKRIERSFLPLKVIKFNDETGLPEKNENNQFVYEEIDNPLAKKAFLLVMMPSNDWVMLNRNHPDNMVLKGILTWGDSSREIIQPEQQDTKGMPKKISQFFKKKNKEETIIGE